jgi:hypothetical protein
MGKFFGILLVFYIALIASGCKKDNVNNLTISNLKYFPDTVTIIKPGATFDMQGTIDFANAAGGVATLRLTSSSGIDLTVPVLNSSETSGTLSGLFTMAYPATAGTYTFQAWIIDKGGNVSNKLQGSVQAVINDNGLSWLTLFQQEPLYRVIWANENFMAVGEFGVILISNDGGHDWVQLNSGISQPLYGVVWSGTQYVAAGLKMIISSPDGNIWTTRFIAPNTGICFYSVAWSGTGFVAAGVDNSNNQTVIYNSTDGVSWTANQFTIAGGNINTVIWAKNQYIAVGKVLGRPLILTSPNGSDWTNRSNSVNTGKGIELNDIVWTGSSYVAVGFGLTANSADGISWNVNDNISWGATGVTWSGHKLMACSIDGFYSSADGINWSKVSSPAYPMRGISWSGYQYVSVGSISPVILVSPVPY